MFIKIKRDDSESLYECECYHLSLAHASNGPDKPLQTTMYIALERDDTNDGITLQLEKDTPNLGVYVMNREGQTIDTIFSNRSRR